MKQTLEGDSFLCLFTDKGTLKVKHSFLADYVLLNRIFKYPVKIHAQLIKRTYNSQIDKK